MSKTSDVLRSTSDALLRDLEVLGALEDEKRSIEPGDPRLVDLASQIQAIAARVLARTVRQRELTESVTIQVASGSPNAPDHSIAATPRHPAAILAEWREAERRLAVADPESAEWTEAAALVELHRDEYRRASNPIQDS